MKHFYTKVFILMFFGVFTLLVENSVLARDISTTIKPAASEVPKAGKAYRVLDTPVETNSKQGVVTVQEFFSYQCEHCHEFNDDFFRWKKQLPATVHVTQVPVFFNKSMKAQALLFYTLQSLGVYDEKVSMSLFNAVQQKRQQLNTETAAANFVQKNTQVSQEAFRKAYRSLDVAREAEEAYDLMVAIRLQAVPALLIDGRYLTDPQMAGGLEKMLHVAEYLVNSIKQHTNKRGE